VLLVRLTVLQEAVHAVEVDPHDVIIHLSKRGRGCVTGSMRGRGCMRGSMRGSMRVRVGV
jgi:hypothetical protein